MSYKILYQIIVVIFFDLLLASQSVLLVVSFDGYRYDYNEMYGAKHFNQFIDTGVKAKSLKPVFPTLTFPNHFSIATGTYPGTHGILANEFYDPIRDESYSYKIKETVQDGSWYKSEPIWVTAEKQGIKSAVYFWPGSEAEINGIRPSIYKEYSSNDQFNARVDSVVSWMQLPESKRPGLIMLYFHEPDRTGHIHGLNKEHLIPTLEKMDDILGYIMQELEKVESNTNVIIVSDHGMIELDRNQDILLNQYIGDIGSKHFRGNGPLMQIDALGDKGLKSKLSKKLKRIPNVHIYYGDDTICSIEEHNHHKDYYDLLLGDVNPSQIGDFLLVAEEGWSLFYDEEDQNSFTIDGMHGYFARNMSMHGIFYANGPMFKEGMEIDTFELIHIYPLLCNILNISPHEGNEGSIDVLKGILK